MRMGIRPLWFQWLPSTPFLVLTSRSLTCPRRRRKKGKLFASSETLASLFLCSAEARSLASGSWLIGVLVWWWKRSFASSQDVVRCTWKAGNWVKVTLQLCQAVAHTHSTLVSFLPSLSGFLFFYFLERDLTFGALRARYGACETLVFQKGYLFACLTAHLPPL